MRCEHATTLEKTGRMRAVIGDRVEVSLPEGHDKGIIERILPRRTEFVRKDPADKTAGQVLAANFDLVIIAQPVTQLNFRRLERELVLAHETGADVAVVLTKSDLANAEEANDVYQKVCDLSGNLVRVLLVSANGGDCIDGVRELIGLEKTAILVGRSGVGKSSLVNMLVGYEAQDTAAVRESDGKGRHTTVDRVMVELPGGGRIVDMPGIRSLGIWDADVGLGTAFADVESVAAGCRFRDCQHEKEPGCAVLAAVEEGGLAVARLESYRALTREVEAVRMQRDDARRLRGEKASDRKKLRSQANRKR